jgi:hypothetical protein
MQFGKALWCILALIIHANPRLGPVYLSEVDISDGFYRTWVRAADVPKLGVLLPAEPAGQERLIGFPVVLPMGCSPRPQRWWRTWLTTKSSRDPSNHHISWKKVLSQKVTRQSTSVLNSQRVQSIGQNVHPDTDISQLANGTSVLMTS